MSKRSAADINRALLELSKILEADVAKRPKKFRETPWPSCDRRSIWVNRFFIEEIELGSITTVSIDNRTTTLSYDDAIRLCFQRKEVINA